jgi:hypothetical protein
MPVILFTLAQAVLQMAQFGQAIGSRLLGPNNQPSVMPVKVYVLAEAILQLVLSWLTVALSKKPAANYQPFVMSAVLFTLAVAALQMALSRLAVAVSRLPAAVLFALASIVIQLASS